MDFLSLYLVIPLFLFFIRPIKNNYIAALYLSVIFSFSYDNVTDYDFFYDIFRQISLNDNYEPNELKKLELGWAFLFRLFSFTDYGYVIIHFMVNSIVMFFFLKLSREIGLLNVSIFLFFILQIVTRQDNYMRQNIPIVLSILAFKEIIENDYINKRIIIKIVIVTTVSFIFHRTAIFIIPFCLFIYWMKKCDLNIYIMMILMIVLFFLQYSSSFYYLMMFITIGLGTIESDITDYYSNWFVDQEMVEGSLLNGLIILFSVVPLIYFKLYNHYEYKSNNWLRVSVNTMIFCICWDSTFRLDIFTRMNAYLMWFNIWGYGYMIKDVFISRYINVGKIMIVSLVICFCSLTTVVHINHYYGNNNYVTILSDDCLNLKVYQRGEWGDKRIRH